MATTIRRVRAEPGGSVRLTVSPDGWTVTRDSGPRLPIEGWLGTGMLVFLIGAGIANALGVLWLTLGLLGVAGLFLVALLVWVLVEFVGTLIGIAWLAGSALTRKGRRKVRTEARELWDTVATAGEYRVRTDQVRTTAVTSGFAGTTTVELTMADGSTQRYTSWRSRRALADAFR